MLTTGSADGMNQNLELKRQARLAKQQQQKPKRQQDRVDSFNPTNGTYIVSKGRDLIANCKLITNGAVTQGEAVARKENLIAGKRSPKKKRIAHTKKPVITGNVQWFNYVWTGSEVEIYLCGIALPELVFTLLPDDLELIAGNSFIQLGYLNGEFQNRDFIAFINSSKTGTNKEDWEIQLVTSKILSYQSSLNYSRLNKVYLLTPNGLTLSFSEEFTYVVSSGVNNRVLNYLSFGFSLWQRQYVVFYTDDSLPAYNSIGFDFAFDSAAQTGFFYWNVLFLNSTGEYAIVERNYFDETGDLQASGTILSVENNQPSTINFGINDFAALQERYDQTSVLESQIVSVSDPNFHLSTQMIGEDALSEIEVQKIDLTYQPRGTESFPSYSHTEFSGEIVLVSNISFWVE